MAHSEFASRIKLLSQMRNDALIFCMYVGQRAELSSLCNHLHIAMRKFVEAGEPDHKDLEARIALGHGVGHLVDYLLPWFEYRGMKSVIDIRFALCLSPPGLDAVLDRLTRF